MRDRPPLRSATPRGPRPTGHARVAWLAAATLVAGCASVLPERPPEPTLHVLASAPAVTAQARRDVVLEVAPPRASPGFDTAQMVYVERPYELDRFAKNQWVDTPARMLGPLLTQALERSGGFRAVVQSSAGVPADVRVATEIVRLQHDFSTRPSRVELTLRVQIVDLRTRRVVATQVFDDSEPAASDDPRGGVAAANAALGRVLRQMVAFCVAETAPR
jgi:cholesterol transport system auxiliary component